MNNSAGVDKEFEFKVKVFAAARGSSLPQSAKAKAFTSYEKNMTKSIGKGPERNNPWESSYGFQSGLITLP